MSLAQGIKNRLDKILTRFTPRRTVYKRVTTRTGGDDLIGVPGVPTVTSTLLFPQPILSRPPRGQVGGYHRPPIFDVSGQREVGTEYLMLVSATAVTEDDLENDALIFVMVDDDGNEELYEVFDFDFTSLQGQDIAYTVGLKSVKR